MNKNGVISLVIMMLMITTVFGNIFGFVETANAELVLDEENDASDPGFYVFWDEDEEWKAQSFKPDADWIYGAGVKIGKSHHTVTTGSLWIEIYDDSGGEPGSRIGYWYRSLSMVPSSMHWEEVFIPQLPAVTPGDTYYLVVRIGSDLGPNEEIYWYATDDNYNRGKFFYSNDDGSTWSPYPTIDLGFRIYGSVGPEKPTNFAVDSVTQDSISLSWTKANDAWKTKVMRKTGSYPANYDDGTQVYFNTGTSCTDTGLNPCTTYYYRAWSYDTNGYYSTNNASVTGTTTSTPALSYSPQSHDFGNMLEGETASTTFEIWNSGTGMLDYVFINNCWALASPTYGSSTGEHDTITVNIDTTGLSVGPHQCDIDIITNAGGGVFTAYVNIFNPNNPVIELTPPSKDFGNVNVGECSSEFSFTLENIGTGTATGTVSLTDNNPNQFDITSGGGGFSIGAGGTKTIKVKFCPTSVGDKSAILKADGSNCNDDSSALSGTGTSNDPVIELTPPSKDFGNVNVGECSSEFSFTLENIGIGTATGTVSCTGNNPNQFVITEGSGSFTLTAGQTKPVKVKFCPTSMGSKSATLLADGSNCNDDSSPLSGEGVVTPDFSFVHITDIHVDKSDVTSIWKWYYTLNRIIKNENPEFIVLTGDISHGGDEQDFEAFKSPLGKLLEKYGKEELKNLLGGFLPNYEITGNNGILTVEGIPIYCAPGNHDAGLIPSLYSFESYYNNIGVDYFLEGFTISGHDIEIFSLNSGANIDPYVDPYPQGDGLSEKFSNEVTNFKNDLSSSNADIKIVLTHHPYVGQGENKDDGIFWHYNQYGNNGPDGNGGPSGSRDEFGDYCEDYDVDLSLNGHLHYREVPHDRHDQQVFAYDISKNVWTKNPSDPTAYVTTDAIGYEGSESGSSYRVIDVYPNGEIAIHECTTIVVPKNRARNRPFLDFLDSHPRMFPLLQRLLNLPIFEKLLNLQ